MICSVLYFQVVPNFFKFLLLNIVWISTYSFHLFYKHQGYNLNYYFNLITFIIIKFQFISQSKWLLWWILIMFNAMSFMWEKGGSIHYVTFYISLDRKRHSPWSLGEINLKKIISAIFTYYFSSIPNSWVLKIHFSLFPESLWKMVIGHK